LSIRRAERRAVKKERRKKKKKIRMSSPLFALPDYLAKRSLRHFERLWRPDFPFLRGSCAK
jgi:cob(I)alamin adenosyltransferase